MHHPSTGEALAHQLAPNVGQSSSEAFNSSAPPGYTPVLWVLPQGCREASESEKYAVWGIVRHHQAALGEASLSLH